MPLDGGIDEADPITMVENISSTKIPLLYEFFKIGGVKLALVISSLSPANGKNTLVYSPPSTDKDIS